VPGIYILSIGIYIPAMRIFMRTPRINIRGFRINIRTMQIFIPGPRINIRASGINIPVTAGSKSPSHPEPTCSDEHPFRVPWSACSTVVHETVRQIRNGAVCRQGDVLPCGTALQGVPAVLESMETS
jgi:hypothetical protein